MIILAVESSCDETAVAISKDEKIIVNLVSSQIKIHAKYGGVVPELAARHHEVNLPILLKEALLLAKMGFDDIDFFAYTAKPGLLPCLNIAKVAVETLGVIWNKPVIPCNHLYGHIYGSLVNEKNEWNYPVLSLITSGGHTQLVYIKKTLNFKIIGSTLDDAVGECFDKVARTLGFPYPGGAKIQELADLATAKIILPQPLKNDKSLNFSFSGLKSAVLQALQKKFPNLKSSEYRKIDLETKKGLAAGLQESIFNELGAKVKLALTSYNVASFVICGGVSANTDLVSSLKNTIYSINKNIKFYVPQLKFCTDNAAMIARLAYAKINILNTSNNGKVDNYHILELNKSIEDLNFQE